MPGAGSGTLVFGLEDSFLGSTSGGLFAFGREPSVSELSIDNALQRMREGDQVWSQNSIKGNFSGALTVEAVVSSDVFPQVESVVFNDGGTAITSGRPQSARVFVGTDYGTSSHTEALKGCIPLSFDLSYEQGGMVTYTLSLAYADQEPDPAEDLSTATQVSSGSELPWHALDLQVDGTSVSDLQSMSLSLSEIARLKYGGSPTANFAEIAAPSAELSANALFTSPSRLDLARGAPDSAPPDQLDSVTGTITLTDPTDDTTLSEYSLAQLKPNGHSWQSLLATDTTADETTFNVDGGVTVA